MKNKIKLLLFTMLLLIPTMVFAEDGDMPGIGVAIGIQLFCTIHMSVFVLMPLASMINNSKKNTVFCILSIIRFVVLAIGDLFIPYIMIMVDFLSIFFFAFIIIPVTKGLLGEHGKTGAKMNDFPEILDKDVFSIGFHSKEELENFIISLFVEIQDAYSVKDINRLKELCADNIFTRYSNEIEKLDLLGQTKVYSDINISKVKINDAYTSNTADRIIAILKMSYKESILDSNKNVVSFVIHDGIYRLKFEKDVSIQEVLSNCPNCGGEIEVHGASVCQFCNCVLDNINRNFVLKEMIKMD